MTTTMSVEERINTSTEFDLSDDELEEFDFFLTTSDNSFNPFDDFRSWFAFDSFKNYNSSGLLARIVKIPLNLGEYQEKRAIVHAMHDIVRVNASGMHRVVTRRKVQAL